MSDRLRSLIEVEHIKKVISESCFTDEGYRKILRLRFSGHPQFAWAGALAAAREYFPAAAGAACRPPASCASSA